jgi:hypothetical protein
MEQEIASKQKENLKSSEKQVVDKKFKNLMDELDLE